MHVLCDKRSLGRTDASALPLSVPEKAGLSHRASERYLNGTAVCGKREVRTYFFARSSRIHSFAFLFISAHRLNEIQFISLGACARQVWSPPVENSSQEGRKKTL